MVKELGLASTSALTMVVRGQRLPGPKFVEKLADYFDFSQSERDYFFDLVRLQKLTDNPRLSVLLMEKMEKKSLYNGYSLLDSKTFFATSNWYHFAIRELVRLPEFQENPYWIAGRLQVRIAPEVAMETLTSLLELGLIYRDSLGRLRVSASNVETTSEVVDEGIKRFHEQMMENAKKSVREVSIDRRAIKGVTLAFSERQIERAKELINEFEDKFLDLLDDERGDGIYQLNIQFFPLTKSRG